MDHFYIILPSNISKDFYGKQPMSSYKTHLAKTLQLDVDKWEVGLAKLIYPHNWNNIMDGKFRIMLLEKDEWTWKNIEILPALY